MGVTYIWDSEQPSHSPCNYGAMKVGLTDTANYWQYIVCRIVAQTKIYFRVKQYGGSWGDWHEISQDVPAFYKNYNNLDSLISAINDNIHIKTGALTAGVDNSITLGTGVLFVARHGAQRASLVFCDYWDTEITQIAGGGVNAGITITKSAESAVVVVNVGTSPDGYYLFIGKHW